MKPIIWMLILLVAGCKSATHDDGSDSNVAVGKRFINAFYSFNRDSLQAILSGAEQSQPEILYYQKWAECAHYKVIDRSHHMERSDSTVIFPVTVQDDLIKALAIDFNVTDTFHISFSRGRISSVKTSSNDPDLYWEAKEWVKKNHPEWIEKACEGIWNGGPTPCECAQGMIKGLSEFTESRKRGR